MVYGLALAAGSGATTPVAAQGSIRIVALGASNTNGKGVSRAQAYPAHLQASVEAARGRRDCRQRRHQWRHDGRNAARLSSAVPSGTKVVILQPGGNDRRRGSEGDRSANIAKIRSQLSARGVTVLMMENSAFAAVPQSERAADGVHFTPRGYAILAQNILPQVLAAIGR